MITKPMCGAYPDPVFCKRYGIVGRWLFNEKGSKIIDVCRNFKTGAISGATWSGSKMGGGLRFDGSDDQVDLGTAINKTDSFTVSVWVTKTTTGDDIIFYNGNSGANGWGYYTTGEKHAWLKGLVAIIDSGISIPLNVLQNVTWVVDASKRPSLYVNGELMYSSSNTGGNAPSGSLGFGNSIGASNYYSGIIDQVIYFNRPLFGSEVKMFSINPWSGLISSTSDIEENALYAT